MPITTQKSSGEIRFTVSGALCQHILDWERGIDERVFEEQLSTGLFRGQPLDDDHLRVMHRAKEQGHIMPYYGAGGNRGACTYSFRETDTGCTIEVENAETGDSAELEDTYDSSDEFEADKPNMEFRIDGQEYQNLRGWAYWSDKEALTPRYIYRFGRVSLGRLGYTVKVEDTEANERIDATHYEDW